MDELYDEFGNYIGPDMPSDAADEADEADEPAGGAGMDVDERAPTMALARAADVAHSQAVVLHEDKQYYPSAQEVYGPGVDIQVQEEDTQPLSEPIVKPTKTSKFQLQEADLPATTYDKRYLVDMMQQPELTRNIVVVGHIHHGKTSLLDTLVELTHVDIDTALKKQRRYTDVHALERARGVSLKAQPMPLLLPDSRGKSWFFSLIDTPGHVNFVDEVVAAARLADGAILVVDAVEGVMAGTEVAVRALQREGLPIVLLVNKVDRLILELKLPPNDAYFKLRHVVDEVNALLQDGVAAQRVSPELGNVCFASTNAGWVLSLRSMADMYADTYPGVAVDDFARRLWGEIFYNPSTRKFSRRAMEATSARSFVHFVLEPLYKLYALIIGEDASTIQTSLAQLGVHVKAKELGMNVTDLLKVALQRFFGPPAALVDMCRDHVPPPCAAAATQRVERFYTGPLDGPVAQALKACDAAGPLMVHVVKMFASDDGLRLDAYGRVLSGRVRPGQRVCVLGEGFSMDDDDDMSMRTLTNVWLYASRYRIDVEEAAAGSLVLLGGLDEAVSKTATLTTLTPAQADVHIFKPLDFATVPVLKIAIEPINPSELPKMLDGLRKVGKTYPMVQTRVEESGEHVLFGTGELYLDCVMHDLRRVYADTEVKVSDPVVRFAETVVETSAIKCFAETPNARNKLSMIAEPLERGIAEDIESGRVRIDMPPRQLGQHFELTYDWDMLASRSIWAFGPDTDGPNILCDDTLPGEVDKQLLATVRDAIRQGFQWATREGPLCDEPVRNVKFKVIHADIATEPIYRGGGQIIPTTRRVCYSSFLTAAPRLMEPLYYAEVQAPPDCVSVIYDVFARRRGHVTKDMPKAGSPHYTVKGLIPVMDACGFETDLRIHTQGQAFVQMLFDHWQVVPGDPLDKSIVLRPLEPSPAPHLARDFMLKTRRRKGLSEDVSVNKYFDEAMMLHMASLQQV